MVESDMDRLEVEMKAMRQEIHELHMEQRAIAETVDQLAQTFRALALQLGIAAEPYKKGSGGDRRKADVPGFA
jgi:hypothetical protein